MGREAGEGKKSVARQRITIVLLQILSPAIAFVPFDDRRGFVHLTGSALWRVCGLFLIASGFTLMAWADRKSVV